METKNKIEFENISIKFGDFYANKNISFSVKNNEIHALLGENGAGKSTLMSILFGLYNPLAGKIKLNGNISKIKTPKDAFANGISMLPQHFKLIDNLSVWENVVLGNEKVKFKFILDKKNALQKLEETKKKYKIKIDLREKVENLSTSDKQKVELLKMLWIDSDILIFDEPTSILTPQEIEEFLKMLVDLKNFGKTIILITHKLEEINKVADRCSILRKGKFIDTVSAKLPSKKLAELMVGKVVDLNLSSIKRTTLSKSADNILEVHKLSDKGATRASSLRNISFNVKKGEILGVASISGNGESELFKLIAGERKITTGKIKLNGQIANKLSVSQRIRPEKEGCKIAYVPEDRHGQGLFLNKSAQINSVMQDIDDYKIKWNGMLKTKLIWDRYKKIEKAMDVRGVNGKNNKVRSLSGGNQQKLIIGRELFRNANLLLAVHPGRGLDVGAIRNIYSRIIEERNEGKSILLFSGELDETIQIADRIIVLNNGNIVGEFHRKEFNKTKIGMLMLNGGKKND